jgi:hypothetical protein
MKRLILVLLGAAANLGLLAAAAQAQPVTLSLSQMDELTAGQAASGSSASVAVSAAGPENTVTATVAGSASATDPQGNVASCEIATSVVTSAPVGPSTVTISCGCVSAASGSTATPPSASPL